MDAVIHLAPTVAPLPPAIFLGWPELPFIGSVLFWVHQNRRRSRRLCHRCDRPPLAPSVRSNAPAC